MSVVADFVLGLAPIAGGMALGAAVGYLKGPDVRRAIRRDMELLEQLPPEQAERRAELQRSIDRRIDDLIAAVDRYRPLRRAAGDLRDVLLFICAVVFTGVWWSVDHHKSTWLPMFIALILVCVLTAGYALRGLHNSIANMIRRDDRPSAPLQS